MIERQLRLGLAGLGRGFMLMLPTFRSDPRLRVVAAADPRPDARRQFESDFGGRAYATVAELCADPDVEMIYVATPHQFHRAHVELAASHGKHVIVEKPMALTLADCAAMIDAAERAGIKLMVGHSHSYNGPVLKTRELIRSAVYGPVRMINAINFTDFLYRPRRPEELDTARGGGVVFSQAAHQIDIVRLLGGGEVVTVRALTGAWDARRPTEGAYTAQLRFTSGAFASITYSGYGHFDSDEFMGWVGELGQTRSPHDHGKARAALAGVSSPDQEAALKETRTYGVTPTAAPQPPRFHNHFGVLIVSCAHADLRQTPEGIVVYGDRQRHYIAMPPGPVPRAEVVDEMYDVAVRGQEPLHSGRWGMATVEVCLAMLESARTGRDITLRHQVPAGHGQPAA